MAESSRRAARSVARGGLPNALFVIAAAERPPVELLGLADDLTVFFPWGSLLRGILGLDEAAARGTASLVRPGGSIMALVSVTERDGADLPLLDATAEAGLAVRWAGHGAGVASFVPASTEAIATTRSTWARRLSAGRQRPAWRLDLTIVEEPEAVADAISSDR